MRWAILALAVFSGGAWADPKPWMKQDDPNSLGLWVYVSSVCPFTEEQVTTDARGEFLRARIAPSSALSGLHLLVEVECLQAMTEIDKRPTGWFMNANIRFGDVGGMLYAYPSYGNQGMAGQDQSGIDFLRVGVREWIGIALTDYLEANFGGQ